MYISLDIKKFVKDALIYILNRKECKEIVANVQGQIRHQWQFNLFNCAKVQKNSELIKVKINNYTWICEISPV